MHFNHDYLSDLKESLIIANLAHYQPISEPHPLPYPLFNLK